MRAKPLTPGPSLTERGETEIIRGRGEGMTLPPEERMLVTEQSCVYHLCETKVLFTRSLKKMEELFRG